MGFTCVRPDVSLQQPRPGESFATDLAHARQGMASDVHLEGSQADVFLLAVLAAERFPGLGVTVQLSVLGKARKGGIGFAALAAVEFLGLGGRRDRAGRVGGGLAILFFAGQGGQVQRLGVRAGGRSRGLLVLLL